jgi:hypothetical protein
MYINGVQCKNSGLNSTVVTLSDSASSVLLAHSGGVDNETFITPLVVAANTALTFTPGTSSSTTMAILTAGTFKRPAHLNRR